MGSSGSNCVLTHALYAAANPACGIVTTSGSHLSFKEEGEVLCASSVGSVSLVAAVGTGALSLAAGGAACIAAQQRGQYQGMGSDQPVNDDNQQPHAQQAPNRVEMTP